MGLLSSECPNCKKELNLIAGEPDNCPYCNIKLDAEYLWKRHYEINKSHYDWLEKRKNK